MANTTECSIVSALGWQHIRCDSMYRCNCSYRFTGHWLSQVSH